MKFTKKKLQIRKIEMPCLFAVTAVLLFVGCAALGSGFGEGGDFTGGGVEPLAHPGVVRHHQSLQRQVAAARELVERQQLMLNERLAYARRVRNSRTLVRIARGRRLRPRRQLGESSTVRAKAGMPGIGIMGYMGTQEGYPAKSGPNVDYLYPMSHSQKVVNAMVGDELKALRDKHPGITGLWAGGGRCE